MERCHREWEEPAFRKRIFSPRERTQTPWPIGDAVSGCILAIGCSAARESFTNSLGMRMIRTPAGSFQIGDLSGRGQWDERPVHWVTISKPFYISETEATIDQFRQSRPDCSGAKTYAPYATGVSWDDAVAFCQWLSQREGRTCRLATEAEWEHVCRAGTTTPYWSGEHPPEPGKANPWGVRNLHSGPLEWCLDWYGPYAPEPQVDPVDVASGMARVVRGGLPDQLERRFEHPEEFYRRSANRAGLPPNFRGFSLRENEAEAPILSAQDSLPRYTGLVGVLYDSGNWTKIRGTDTTRVVDSDQVRWPGLNDWSARWRGSLVPSGSGRATLYLVADGEAWILADEMAEDTGRTVSRATKLPELRTFRETYPDGKLRATWSVRQADDGRFLPHGRETWFYPDGVKQWEVVWRLGRKVGRERYWDRRGRLMWEWEHREDGTSVWRQYWPNGQIKAESSWRNRRCEGVARRWDREGRLVSEVKFRNGKMVRAR